MAVHTPATNQSFGRTFMVAAALLGIVAVLQLGAVTWAFFNKSSAGLQTGTDDEKPVPSKIDVSNIPVVDPPDAPLVVGDDPIAEVRPGRLEPIRAEPARPGRPVAVPENPAARASAGPLVPPRPTPVPLTAFTPKVDPRFGELVEQGKLLRNTGDTAGALVKFREAALIEPGNPLPLAETAYTFEKMSLFDKAAEQWRQILAMGENAGVYYSAAQAKLNAAIADTTRSVAGTPAVMQIPEGKVLAIGVPRLEEDADPASAKKFTLHVPIRAKAGEAVSVRDMTVIVYFYDKLAGTQIVRTTADVKSRWESPPVDWTDGEETLEVLYDLPPNDGRGEPRSYYGYIVRIYYQNELQDTQALPASLNQKFPAEYQLPEIPK
jgi:hypothetical protein